MITIKIVKNSDRCHASMDGIPQATFLYSNYPENTDAEKQAHAINDAKIWCFNLLRDCQENKQKAVIDTKIETK